MSSRDEIRSTALFQLCRSTTLQGQGQLCMASLHCILARTHLGQLQFGLELQVIPLSHCFSCRPTIALFDPSRPPDLLVGLGPSQPACRCSWRGLPSPATTYATCRFLGLLALKPPRAAVHAVALTWQFWTTTVFGTAMIDRIPDCRGFRSQKGGWKHMEILRLNAQDGDLRQPRLA